MTRHAGLAAGRRAGQRGATTVEMAMLAPLLVTGLLVLAQVVGWAAGQLCAGYAANHALQATRVADGSATAGEDDAAAALAGLDAHLIDRVQISATRDTTVASVHIHGSAVRIVPFLHLPVAADVSAPVEATPSAQSQP